MTVRQLWVQASPYNAIDDRSLIAAMLPPGTAGPLGSKVGLRSTADLVLTMETGGATGTVSKGAAFIVFGGSVYLLTNDDQVAVAFSPADPTNARIDIVVAQVYDAEAGGTDGDPQIRVISGAAAADPVAPAVPAGALLLNTVRFNAGSTAPINTRNATTDIQPVPYAPPFPAGAITQVTAGGSLSNSNWTYLSCGGAQTFLSGSGMRGDSQGIIVNEPGLYICYCYMQLSSSAPTGRRMLGVSASTSTQPGGTNFGSMMAHAGILSFQCTVPWIETRESGGRLNLWGFQDSGGTLSISNRQLTVVRTA